MTSQRNPSKQRVLNSFGHQSISYLLVDVRPVVDQQLQTKGPVGGDGSQVQRGVATSVGLVHVSPVVYQLGGHSLLSHVACHVERSVPKAIGLIDLTHKNTEQERAILT